MSVKYSWWGYAKAMIRAYPMRKAQYEDIIDMSAIPNNDGMPKGTAVSNPVESLMISAEQKTAYQEYWAVKKALDLFVMRHGLSFMDYVRLYYWTEPRFKLERIADRMHLAPETIFRWNRQLIKAVGRNRGFID